MTNVTPPPVNRDIINDWIENRLDAGTIKDQLKAKGIDTSLADLYLKEYLRLRHEKKRFKGFMLAGIGAFLGFVSCVLSVLNPLPELFHVFLYGLTSLAIIFIVAGLYFLFE
jgi:hypothetical protein